MKRNISRVLFCLILVLTACTASPENETPTEIPDIQATETLEPKKTDDTQTQEDADQDYIAIVFNEVISIEEFEIRVRLMRLQYIYEYQFYLNLSSGTTDESTKTYYSGYMNQYLNQLEPDIIGPEVLEQMVNEILTRQEAQSLGIQISEAELTAELQGAFGYFPDEAETVTEGSETPSPTSISPSEYWQALDEYLSAYEEYGVTEGTILSMIEAQLYQQELFDYLSAEVDPNEHQVHARHILVADRETAEDLLARLEDGESWEDLALEYSLDTSNSSNGGDLGWFSKGDMVQPFNDAAFTGEVGSIVGPVETTFGFHLIEILERESQPLSEADFSAQVDQIIGELLEEIKEAGEQSGDIIYLDNWIDYTPTEPNIVD